MVDSVKRMFGKLSRSIVRHRRNGPAPVRFEEAEFFDHLSEPSVSARAWRGGRRDAAWEGVIAHFSRRTPPLGFLAPDRIPALLADAGSRFPDWRERLLVKVREERRQGLAVYDRRSAPMDGAFDWSAAPEGPLEDRLYGVRPHRLGFVPRWALACHYDRTLITALEDVLRGWMAAARRDGHPAYKSSHVVVYHFVAMVLSWPFLAALEGHDDGGALAALRRRVVQILYEDSRILRAVAGDAVGNNHLLAERFADWLTAALLPEFDHALEREAAEASWLAELERQFYDDGGSFEHSVHYQEHGCEMAVAFLLLSRRNGWPVPKPTLGRIESMLAFQLALSGPDLLPLALGNTTEDPLLALGVGEGWQSGCLREVQRACFAPNAPPAATEDPTRETAFWLLDGGLSADPEEPVPEAPFQAFPESGFCLFVEPASRARLIFRLGPSPIAPGIGGHSHGDLLSLYLSIGGTMILAPSGTYSYRFKPHPSLPGRPNLRAHFASAASHSALFIEGEEPYGPLAGDFRNWRLPCQVETRHATAAAAGLSWAEGRVVGEGATVDHRRGVIHVWEHYWLVYDRIPTRLKEAHTFIGWQFGPAVTCRLQEGGALASCDATPSARLTMHDAGLGLGNLVSGSFEPVRGWVSPSYGRLEPAVNLRYAVPPETENAAFLLAPTAKAGLDLKIAFDHGEALGLRVTEQGAETHILINRAEEPDEISWGDFRFRGRLLVLRRQDDGGILIRALGLRGLDAPKLGLALNAAKDADFELIRADGPPSWPRGRCAALEVVSGGPGVALS